MSERPETSVFVPDALAPGLPVVWIVDDSALERALAVKSLATKFSIRPFADGLGLLEALATGPLPDVVLLDWVMPGVSGLDVCKFLRAREETRHLPVLVLSSQSAPDDVVEALEAGATDYLFKPFAAPLLVARIQSLILVQRAMARGVENHPAVEALHQAKLRYRALIEGMPDLVIVVTQGKVVFMNPRALETFANGEPERMIGQPVTDLIHPSSQAEALERLARVAQGATTDLVEQKMVGADGAEISFEISSRAVVFDGQVSVLIVARDISVQKHAQSQLLVSDRMASVGLMAAGVAHEINNPLACILANLDYAIEELAEVPAIGIADDVARSLVEARESSARVRQIVRDMKVFSRADEADRVGVVDVQSVIESSLRMGWNEIRHRARLVKDYGTVLPVLANDGRLGQVFLNLLVNAAQAIPEGNSTKNEIRIVTRMQGARVAIDIRDTGPGIPPEILSRLFTPFFTTKPIGSGTGLGLSICQRLVHAMGGELKVDSQVGQGTTFTVLLPSTREDHVSAQPIVAAPVALSRRGSILVVDDEIGVAHAIQRTLRKDHDVVAVISAHLAMEQILAGRCFDVILCDLMMPQMTGMELHANLLRCAPGQASRMVFLSGGAFSLSARAFLDDISNQKIDKPFDAIELRGIIATRVLANALESTAS